jgi:hypothetical protein
MLGDSLSVEIQASIFSPRPLSEFAILKRKTINSARDTADENLQNFARWVIGWKSFIEDV